MLSKLTCPECQKVLKPAKPVPEGKKVKCPGCSEVFVAGETSGGGGDIKSPKSRESAKKKPPAKRSKPEPSSKPEKKKPDKKKSGIDVNDLPDSIPLAPMDDDDDDEGPATYSFQDNFEEEEEKKPQIEYAPDMSVKDLRGPAQEAVITPSNMVLRNGIIGFLGWLAFLTIILIPIVLPVVEEGTEEHPIDVLKIEQGLAKFFRPPEPGGGNDDTGEPAPKVTIPKKDKKDTFFSVAGFDFRAIAEFSPLMMCVAFLPFIFGMAYCALTCFGAIKAQNLESRAWGIVASIMTLIPIAPFGFLVVLLMFFEMLAGMFIDDWSIVNYTNIGGLVGEVCSQFAVGGWLLAVLLREEVTDGFNYVPDDEAGDEEDEDDDEYDDDDDEYDDDDDDDYYDDDDDY